MNARFNILMACSLILSPVVVVANDASLSWLQGHWCLDAGNEQIEEYWFSSADGESLGVGRTLTEGKMTSFEYMRITSDGASKVYTAQPGGSEPTHFKAVHSGENWIAFENLQHDFPQQVEYRREANALRARISGPGEGGKELSFDFDYRQCPQMD